MTAPLDFEFNLEPGYFTNLDRVAAISATRTSSRPQPQEAVRHQPGARIRLRGVNSDAANPLAHRTPPLRVPAPPAATMNAAPPRPPPPESSGAGCEEEIMDDALRQAKLAKLIEIEGYESLEQLLEAVIGDSVSPTICTNADCTYTCEMEPDQERGYCDECRTNTMVAAPVLASII